LLQPGQRACVSKVFQIVAQPGVHIQRSCGPGAHSHFGQKIFVAIVSTSSLHLICNLDGRAMIRQLNGERGNPSYNDQIFPMARIRVNG
jgi:hypothetical protein